MKKQLLCTVLAFTAGSALADDEAQERAKDHAQPVPNASLTKHVVTEQTTVRASELGTEVNTTKAVTVNNSEQGQLSAAQTSAKQLILPQGNIIDNQMDLHQTIDKMQATFTELQSAPTISTMRVQANVLTEYAGQAALLLERGDYQDYLANREQTATDLRQLRGVLIELNTALEADDMALARTKIDVIAQAQERLYHAFQAQ